MLAESPRVDPHDNENYELCHACGGLCCMLYLARDENGNQVGEEWLPAYIEVWLERFVASGALMQTGDDYIAGAAGVEPLHDPRISSLDNPKGEAYRASLPDWIDVLKCQFCDPFDGCMLPGEYRAPICHSYHCELWPEG